MFNRKHHLLFLSLTLLSLCAIAGDVTVRGCDWRILNALNRLEIKGNAPLEIFEYRIDKPIDHIFGGHQLELAPLETKFKEKVAIFRNPGVSRFVYKNAFEETRFISDVPSEDFTKLLKENTMYTYTIQDKKITWAQTKPGVIRDNASKHALLSADKESGPLRMAGEMWKDEKGVLHFDQGSGTYKPGAEDLARADVFFKETMGLKNAVPHMFEPPVIPAVVTPAAKPGLVTRVKNIEVGQWTIFAKRRLVAGIKFNAVTKSRMDYMTTMHGETISLIDPNGKEVRYKVAKMETMVREETLFDTEDLDLNKKHQQIKTSKTFSLSNEKNIQKKTSLKENEPAVVAARKSIGGNDPLVPVAKTRNESVQLGLFPVDRKGRTSSKASFVISMDTKTTTGMASNVKGKSTQSYSASVEDLSTGTKSHEKEITQISDQLQKRFGLENGAPEKSGNMITALESNNGQ